MSRFREVLETDTPAPRARLRKATRQRALSPGYSVCKRCGAPWKHVEGHTTMITAGEGMFPLCELCWGELTPIQRLPYYKHLLREWADDAAEHGYDDPEHGPGFEELVGAAVMAGR